MKLLLLPLVCLSARLVLADNFRKDENIIVLTGKNFQEALDHFDNILVAFFVPWCGHCKAFKPDYVRIASILQDRGQNVVCAKVDAPEEQELIEKYDIQGFPTLKLFRKDKKPDAYQGFRSVDVLVDWVTRKIGPPAITLEDNESADKFKESADVVIAAYFKDPASNESLTFSEVADQYDDYKFAITHKEDVASKLGFTKEGIRLFRKFDVDYDGDLKSGVELKSFIQANSLPLVVTNNIKEQTSNETMTCSAVADQFGIYKLAVNHKEDIATKLSYFKEGIKLSSKFDECEPQSLVSFMETKTEINNFNKRMISPRIKSLVTLDYFRYVKVNLNRPCELWCDTSKCSLRDCKVKVLSDPSKCPVATDDNELSTVNRELASDQLDLLMELFECHDDDDHDSQYVDLLINPERYTGYSGESARRVWRAIYEENCFLKGSKNPFSPDLCYEERLFYEAISGLHSSINIHLCAEYPTNGLIGTFEPNLEEFLRRFEWRTDYLNNLYTLFLLELKALTVSESYLMKRVNWPEPSTRDAVHDLLKVASKLDMPMFRELSLKPSHVSHELASHFRNITTSIMDCVACDKCKLWGKVQLRGLGAAFKILSVKQLDKLNLHHQEIVSLINAIARLSHSIGQLETFKDLYISSKFNKYGLR